MIADWQRCAEYPISACDSFRNKKKNSQALLYGATGRNASRQGGFFHARAAIPDGHDQI
jgi:hypothetical protein